MPINEWWGREQDFLAIALLHPRTFVRVMPESPWYVTVEPGSPGMKLISSY